ncbi:MAG: hypothetical protein ABSF99_08090 [Anaerolineales bacterium]
MGEKKVRVAIIGVGNRASSLVQGIVYYKNTAYFFKTPPKQFRDDICREKTEAFIQGKE